MNETNINIGGKARILKGTFQNLNEIEKALGCSIMAFITPYIQEGKFQPTFSQLSQIIYQGLNGNSENRMTLAGIENEIAENGIFEYSQTAIEFLVRCIAGTKKKPTTAESEISPQVSTGIISTE